MSPAPPTGSEDFGPASKVGPFELGTDGPKIIMVGLDGSVTSMRAAAYAGGLARRQNCRLIVVYVAAPSMLGALADGMAAGAERETLGELCTELRQAARAGAEEFGVTVTFLARRGDPFLELRRAADEVRADMVVVGASTRAGHRFVGSIATRLVRAGRWPVVVVP